MPFKNGYRRFKIKKIYNQNDFSMMEEIIIRRYKIKDPDNEKDGNYLDTNNVIRNSKDLVEKEEFPNLIIIDGGKGHLNVALKALKKIKLEKIECISLAKENEEIFTPFLNNSIIIPKNKKSLKILQHIRDESHRFGLTYNRKLRKIMIE
jgi:excinuclease ABC subunit C